MPCFEFHGEMLADIRFAHIKCKKGYVNLGLDTSFKG